MKRTSKKLLVGNKIRVVFRGTGKITEQTYTLSREDYDKTYVLEVIACALTHARRQKFDYVSVGYVCSQGKRRCVQRFIGDQ